MVETISQLFSNTIQSCPRENLMPSYPSLVPKQIKYIVENVELDREFTIADGEITPTFKIKRNVVEKKYKDLIDDLDTEGNRE
jgi:long-subunit acyl-CoA synthetase (AMP-forming)